MKINEYIVQQRQQHWNSNKHNKLQEIKLTLWEWKQGYRKKQKEVILSKLCTSHIKTTHSCLLEAKQQPKCHACQTEYTVNTSSLNVPTWPI